VRRDADVAAEREDASFRSSPEQKPLPAPVITTTRTAGSASASTRASERAASIGPVIAFSRSGRFSVSVAIAPSFA